MGNASEAKLYCLQGSLRLSEKLLTSHDAILLKGNKRTTSKEGERGWLLTFLAERYERTRP